RTKEGRGNERDSLGPSRRRRPGVGLRPGGGACGRSPGWLPDDDARRGGLSGGIRVAGAARGGGLFRKPRGRCPCRIPGLQQGVQGEFLVQRGNRRTGGSPLVLAWSGGLGGQGRVRDLRRFFLL